jgi:hypothetical protein
MNTACRVAAAILFLSLAAVGQDEPKTFKPSAPSSPLDPVRFLIGHWTGTTQGEPGQGKGERHYDLVLGGKFLRGTNKTVYPPQEKNPKGEVHEDISYFSFDRTKTKLILRQFHIEGFVNEYVERSGGAADGKGLVLETERIENIPDGWRARETYKVAGPDEFIEVFELAPPQKDFAVYAESRWKRVK